MVKKTLLAAPPAKRPRGRPPRPSGPIPQVEVQRAYRARLAAAGKVVRIVDANPAPFATIGQAASMVPDYDPGTHFMCERQVFGEMRKDRNDLFLKNKLLVEERTRIAARNSYLEAELKRLESTHTVALKEIIVLKAQMQTTN